MHYYYTRDPIIKVMNNKSKDETNLHTFIDITLSEKGVPA